jgi:hypothetical protein
VSAPTAQGPRAPLASRAPQDVPGIGVGARIGMAAVRVYQIVVSPMLGPACRYQPSCSAFALEALARHGLWRGGWLALRRLLRCHPFGGHGYDPVP